MANYQLVAWTEDGQVRMIPSEVNAFMLEGLDEIERLIDGIRYGTRHEVGDILRVSYACERLGLRLLGVGRLDDAFLMYVRAAEYCCSSDNNWEDTEYGEVLCRPLRGRFFAMFCQCKDLVRQYPRLRPVWAVSGLQGTCDFVTSADRLIEAEIAGWYDYLGK
jgi:hypothetical protein